MGGGKGELKGLWGRGDIMGYERVTRIIMGKGGVKKGWGRQKRVLIQVPI